MKSLNKLMILVAVLSYSAFALAVRLSQSHQGGSIFLPLYSADNGNSSLLTISNNGVNASAVKVLFQDQAGATISGVNLYLAAMDTWVMSISSNDQGVAVSIPDSSCTAPYYFESDDPSAELALPTVGQILVTDMGEVTGNSEIAIEIDYVTLLPRDCELINAQWAVGGVWNTVPDSDILLPAENLRAELQVINVNEGTLVTVPGLAFTDFSDSSLHTSPNQFTPDLSSVNSADSAYQNGAKSVLASSDGPLIVDDWSNSIDAISVLLATRNLTSAFSAETSIGATAEWVLTFPTLKYYEGAEGAKDFSEAKISYRSTDRNTLRVFDCVPPPIVFIPCPPDGEFTLGSYWVAIGSSNESQLGISQFYGSEGHELVSAGQLQVGLNSNLGLNFIGQSGVEYFGLPIYAFGIQKYINGYLPGVDSQTVLANYRTHIEITLDRYQKSN